MYYGPMSRPVGLSGRVRMTLSLSTSPRSDAGEVGERSPMVNALRQNVNNCVYLAALLNGLCSIIRRALSALFPTCLLFSYDQAKPTWNHSSRPKLFLRKEAVRGRYKQRLSATLAHLSLAGPRRFPAGTPVGKCWHAFSRPKAGPRPSSPLSPTVLARGGPFQRGRCPTEVG